MPRDFSVLFVCMGNICRSPAAEIVFRQQVENAGLADRIHIDSAGTIGYHTGKGPDPRMAATLKSRGYTISGRARQVTAADLDRFDLVLAADEENLADLHRMAGSHPIKAEIRLLVDFCQRHQAKRVPDPYYGGQKGFEEVADLVEDACEGLLEWIRSRVG